MTGRGIQYCLVACSLGIATVGSLSLAQAQAASEAAASPDAVHQQATREYREGNYPRALELAGEGLAREPEHLGLLYLRASILQATNRCDAALQAYQAYVDARPPRGNARKVKDILRHLRVCKKTRLKITVERGPARVYLMSKRLGLWCTADPVCETGVLPRRYTIIVERDGFSPERDRVRVARNKTKKHDVALRELPSPFSVKVAPADADVLINGELKGTEAYAAEMPPGDYQLRVQRHGYLPYEATFSAREGQTVGFEDIVLTELVEVGSVYPAGAALYLDERPIAVQDGAFPLPEGCRDGCVLMAKATGYRDREIPIPAQREPPHQLGSVRLEKKLPPPPPPPPPAGWTWRKRGAVAASSAAALATLGLSLYHGNRARTANRDASGECQDDGGPGISCSAAGFADLDRARDAAERANLYAALSIMSGVVLVTALDMEEEPERGWPWSRRLSLAATAGVAAAGLGAGVFYGLRARSRHNDAQAFCNDGFECQREGFTLERDAISDAKRSTLAFATAGVAAAGAVVVWLAPLASKGRDTPTDSADGSRAARLRFTPSIQPDALGLSVHGRF